MVSFELDPLRTIDAVNSEVEPSKNELVAESSDLSENRSLSSSFSASMSEDPMSLVRSNIVGKYDTENDVLGNDRSRPVMDA